MSPQTIDKQVLETEAQLGSLGEQVKHRALKRGRAARQAIQANITALLPEPFDKLADMMDTLLFSIGFVEGWIVPGPSHDMASSCQDLFELAAITETLLGEAVE